jgi:hypothetical protein
MRGASFMAFCIDLLVATSLLASLFCFSILAADYDCGAQSWDCATFSGIAVIAVSAGLALGFLLTAVIVVLGWGVLLVRPMARAPEPRARAGRVALTLVLLHLLAFGMLNTIGILAMGWKWWLGVFGAIGIHSPGATYMFVPSH